MTEALNAPAITYHDRLRRARLEAGLDQRALAKLIGCSPSTIGAVEAGHTDLGASRLIRWAGACGVSLDWVATGTPSALKRGRRTA